MINTSLEYKKAIKEPSRQFETKITIGQDIYTNANIQSFTLEDIFLPSDSFSIGGTTSQKLNMTFINSGAKVFAPSKIKLEAGLKTGAKFEYVLMGYFNIDDVKRNDLVTEVLAFDNMIKFEQPYFSSLAATPTLQEVINELSTITGVLFNVTLPKNYTVTKLEGYTCREVLGFVASICGGNAKINREGKVIIVKPSDTGLSINTGHYFSYKTDESKYKIGKVTCKSDGKTISKGTLTADTMELQFENPWVNETILNDIYTALNGFEYLGYQLDWKGDLSLDTGDIITITDRKNVTRKAPIFKQKLTYTGGLKCDMEAKSDSKNQNSFNSSGTVTQKVDRYTIEQAHIKEALLEKASIKELEAEKAKIHTLTVDTATIKEILAGNITADNIQADFLSVLKGWMLEGSIGDAQISNLNAGKITAGDIDTSKVRVVSKDGAIEITGNQILINDTTDPLKPINRIVIGKVLKDNGVIDYSILIRGKDGKTVMFDSETGVTNAGITSGAVADNSISDTASIKGYKLDINSVLREVNEKGTVTISGTKIQVGNKILEVALTEQQNIVDGQQATLKNHETRIKANEDSILLKASKKELDTAVSNIKVGARNLAPINLVGRYAGGNVYTGELTNITKEGYILTVTGSPKDVVGFIANNVLGDTITITGETSLATIQCHYQFKDNSDANIDIQRNTSTPTTSGKFIFQLKVPVGATKVALGLGEHPYSKEYSIAFVKVENGNKDTDFTPAPEDIDNKIDTNTAEINKAMTEQSSQILLEAGKIVNEVTSQHITQGEFDAYVELQNTKLTQDKNSWEFKFNEIKKQIDNTGTDNNSKFEAISKYIRFESGNIILGEVGNDLLLTISNNRIYFTQGGSGQEVAYFSNNKLYITNAEILTSIQIGNYSFIPRANGNLSFKWTGGK